MIHICLNVIIKLLFPADLSLLYVSILISDAKIKIVSSPEFSFYATSIFRAEMRSVQKLDGLCTVVLRIRPGRLISPSHGRWESSPAQKKEQAQIFYGL
jgi:hypothetical protein